MSSLGKSVGTKLEDKVTDINKYNLLLKCSFQRGLLLINNTKPLTVVKMKDNSEVPLTAPSRNALHKCDLSTYVPAMHKLSMGKNNNFRVHHLSCLI